MSNCSPVESGRYPVNMEDVVDWGNCFRGTVIMTLCDESGQKNGTVDISFGCRDVRLKNPDDENIIIMGFFSPETFTTTFDYIVPGQVGLRCDITERWHQKLCDPLQNCKRCAHDTWASELGSSHRIVPSCWPDHISLPQDSAEEKLAIRAYPSTFSFNFSGYFSASGAWNVPIFYLAKKIHKEFVVYGVQLVVPKFLFNSYRHHTRSSASYTGEDASDVRPE